MSAISSQISDWPCSPLLSEEHQLSSPALAKCSVCELRLEKLCVCGHNPLSAFEQLRPPRVAPGDLNPTSIDHNPSPSIRWRSFHREPQQEYRRVRPLADRATDHAGNVAQHIEEFANNAAQRGREAGSGSRRLPATSRCCHPGGRPRKVVPADGVMLLMAAKAITVKATMRIWTPASTWCARHCNR